MVASVGLVVNMVVPALFRSMVVLFVVPAVPTQRFAPITRRASVARWVFATFVATVPIAPATAKRSFSDGIAVHFSEEASIDAIVSPMMVTVVSGAEYEELTTIPHFTADDSVHFMTRPRENVAVTSQDTVKVVFPVRVQSAVVHSEEPETVQLLFADKSYAVPLMVSVVVFGTNPLKSWSPVFVPEVFDTTVACAEVRW